MAVTITFVPHFTTEDERLESVSLTIPGLLVELPVTQGSFDEPMRIGQFFYYQGLVQVRSFTPPTGPDSVHTPQTVIDISTVCGTVYGQHVETLLGPLPYALLRRLVWSINRHLRLGLNDEDSDFIRHYDAMTEPMIEESDVYWIRQELLRQIEAGQD